MGRNFDGIDDKIDYGDDAAFDSAFGDLVTFSWWMKPANLSQGTGVINKRDAHDSNNSYSMGFNYVLSTSFYVQIGNAAGTAVGIDYHWSTSGWSTTQFERFTVLLDTNASAGNKIRLYRDGSLVTVQGIDVDTAKTGITDTSSSLVFGRVNSSGSAYYDGDAAEFAIWNGNLNVGEIASPGPASRIRPDLLQIHSPIYGSGSVEADLSGNGNNGTVTGTTKSDHPPVGPYAPVPLWTPVAAGGAPPAGGVVSGSLSLMGVGI
jgi:hypothetical protein